MDEQELKARIEAAFGPFLNGFCAKAQALHVTIQTDRIDADAALAAEDFSAIVGDIHVQSALKQAFSALCRANDLTRGASLAFKKLI